MAEYGETAMTLEAVSGPRVGCRRYRAEDATIISTWFDEAICAAYGRLPPPYDCWSDFRDRYHIDDDTNNLLIFTGPGSDEAIGLGLWEEVDTGVAVIHLLLLDRNHRSLGYGAEAVRLLEDHVNRLQVWAPVLPDNGLSVYFWFRLGYHPVMRDQQPAFARGQAGAWLTREITRIPGAPYPSGAA